jgi:antitoxin (DNA-binding transcriptional repressor) of toxin-antitoxin stability system
MSTISLHDFAMNPQSILERIEAGESLLLSRDGKTIAELRPVTPSSHSKRPYGLAAGQFEVPDDFNAPLPEDVLAVFAGGN